MLWDYFNNRTYLVSTWLLVLKNNCSSIICGDYIRNQNTLSKFLLGFLQRNLFSLQYISFHTYQDTIKSANKTSKNFKITKQQNLHLTTKNILQVSKVSRFQNTNNLFYEDNQLFFDLVTLLFLSSFK